MKVNKYIFWIFSLIFSLISCWLFEKASTELHTDYDYLQSLDIPSTADTTMIPIAGGFIAAFYAAIAHGFVHLLFLIYIIFKKGYKEIDLTLRIGKQVNGFQNIVLIICYFISILWIIDYLSIVKIKFYLFNTVFMVIAILTTFIYAWWIIIIFKKRQKS